jgi:hypothetical protein
MAGVEDFGRREDEGGTAWLVLQTRNKLVGMEEKAGGYKVYINKSKQERRTGWKPASRNS